MIIIIIITILSFLGEVNFWVTGFGSLDWPRQIGNWWWESIFIEKSEKPQQERQGERYTQKNRYEIDNWPWM